jgi:hypothetical protein
MNNRFLKYFPIFIFFIAIGLNSCSENEDIKIEEKVQVNQLGIDAIISSLDHTTNVVKKNNIKDKNASGQIFADYYNENYASNFNIISEAKSVKNYTPEYVNFANQMGDVSLFDTSNEYVSHINSLSELIQNSNLNITEKTELVNKIELSKAIIVWVNSKVASEQLNSFAKKSDWGWWDTTKCVLGTVGLAGGGAIAGAAVGGVGCTMVLPIIGTVACGTVGAVAGGVFGAMVGVASFC